MAKDIIEETSVRPSSMYDWQTMSPEDKLAIAKDFFSNTAIYNVYTSGSSIFAEYETSQGSSSTFTADMSSFMGYLHHVNGYGTSYTDTTYNGTTDTGTTSDTSDTGTSDTYMEYNTTDVTEYFDSLGSGYSDVTDYTTSNSSMLIGYTSSSSSYSVPLSDFLDYYAENGTSDSDTSDSGSDTSDSTSETYDSYERIIGGMGSQRLYGSEYDDYITSGGGADKIFGGAGDDVIEITGDAGGDIVEVLGGEGDDTIVIASDFIGTIAIDSGEGLDKIEIGQEVTNIFLQEDGNAGHLVYEGDGFTLELLNQLEKDAYGSWKLSENAVEWIEFNDGTFEFFDPDVAAEEGDGQAITIRGSEADDILPGYSPESDVVIEGFGGNDLLTGGVGDDVLRGGAGDDALFGYGGDDELDGGADNDILFGGSGDNTLIGGEGANIFIVDFAGNDPYDVGDLQAFFNQNNESSAYFTDYSTRTTNTEDGGITTYVVANYDYLQRNVNVNQTVIDEETVTTTTTTSTTVTGYESTLLASFTSWLNADGMGDYGDGMTGYDDGMGEYDGHMGDGMSDGMGDGMPGGMPDMPYDMLDSDVGDPGMNTIKSTGGGDMLLLHTGDAWIESPDGAYDDDNNPFTTSVGVSINSDGDLVAVTEDGSGFTIEGFVDSGIEVIGMVTPEGDAAQGHYSGDEGHMSGDEGHYPGDEGGYHPPSGDEGGYYPPAGGHNPVNNYDPMALTDTLNQFMFGGMGISDNEVQFYAISKDGYAVSGMGDTILVADEANITDETDPIGENMIHLHGAEGDDIIFGNDNDVDNAIDHIMGGDGNDYIRAYGGDQLIYGGSGDDIFVVDFLSGDTVIYGDVSSGNISYGDTVLLNFEFDPEDITISGDMYTISTTDDNGGLITVELHDVEKLVFFDADGGMTTKLLTDGSVVNVAANYEDVNFRFYKDLETGNDMISVVQESEVWVVDTPAKTVYRKKGAKDRTSPKKGYKKVVIPEEGHYETQTDIFFEGSKEDVMAFEFMGGVTVNVVKAIDEDMTGQEVVYTEGTDGIDIIYGTDSDNVIDAKGGDDIIIGGDGDDVIIGGDGDDVIFGGDGDDTLLGDDADFDAEAFAQAYLDDAIEELDPDSFEGSEDAEEGDQQEAAPAYEEGDSEGGETDGEVTEEGGAGDDIIIGGEGIDTIETGDGDDIAATGDFDLDGDGNADMEILNSELDNITFEDDDYV